MLEKIEEYYKTLAPRLTNYLVANGTSYATACEIVQETFLKLWKNRDTIDDDNPSRVSGLIWSIARNLRTDRFRHEQRISYDPYAGVDMPDATYQKTSDDDINYLRGRINAALADLPPLLRDAYTLFHVAELSVREIAVQTGATESLVKVRIFRAKEKLQKSLGDLKEWN